MPSRFPGMDPYLEDPEIWPGVHAAMLGAIFELLGPVIRPKYIVRYEERVYVTSAEDPGYRMIVPDVRIVERTGLKSPVAVPAGSVAITEPIKVELADDEIHERSIKIIDAHDRSVVTVLEVLSPTNKVLNSFGRESFLRKRRDVFASDSHWLEIDLLREGARTANPPGVPQTEYQVYLSRAGAPRQRYVWPVSLRDRLPVIRVPLRGDDPDVPLDLQAVFDRVVERGSYDLDTNYQDDPIPPLTPEAAEWARRIVKSRQI